MEVQGWYWRARLGARGHVFPASRAFETCRACPRVSARAQADVPVSYPRGVVCFQDIRQRGPATRHALQARVRGPTPPGVFLPARAERRRGRSGVSARWERPMGAKRRSVISRRRGRRSVCLCRRDALQALPASTPARPYASSRPEYWRRQEEQVKGELNYRVVVAVREAGEVESVTVRSLRVSK